ncbi:hypothetical protein GCM10009840_31850 [Pseudolysinimonas kribbensis]|uniref:Large exoprotein n=1 Tax=Pseudolysinimonas kribbensis TaxID=433641 RepID=A0ABQ6K5Q4_9MICO|nr:hypothetical protein [Pseudolysinimonas kribbensis]GMA95937.1 hypothetical protein GCM10025881_27610 [Pseudolysinimonas kribbensis]
MEATGIGTAIMLALAAGLWFLYLVPTWLRRREYLATERTATRLQQTLRVMAETAEVPEPVRVEATVREAAKQERVLQAQERAERRRLAEQLRRDEVAERALDRSDLRTARVASGPELRRRRMRRTRVLASMLMVAATVVGAAQVVLIATTGAVTGSWVVLVAAAAGACAAVGVQRRLDALTAPRATGRPASPAASVPAEAPAAAADAPRAWTPVPLPRPRYLEHPVASPTAPRIDAAALLRAAAAEAERARRAAHDEPEVVPFRPRATPASAATSTVSAGGARPGASSRFARMGLLDPADTAATDLDEVLRRRRWAG